MLSYEMMPSADSAEALHDTLIANLQRRGGPWPGCAWDPAVLAAVRAVPRHSFVDEVSLDAAYLDQPQRIPCGQTISQPTVVAMMTQALELGGDKGCNVLEIGTGSGYHAAVVSKLARHVFSVELHRTLATRASERFRALGYDNISVHCADGHDGWPAHAPYDRVLLTAAPPALPTALVDQLVEGGILVAPIGEDGTLQRLLRHRKRRGALSTEDLGGVMFVPMRRAPPPAS